MNSIDFFFLKVRQLVCFDRQRVNITRFGKRTEFFHHQRSMTFFIGKKILLNLISILEIYRVLFKSTDRSGLIRLSSNGQLIDHIIYILILICLNHNACLHL